MYSSWAKIIKDLTIRTIPFDVVKHVLVRTNGQVFIVKTRHELDLLVIQLLEINHGRLNIQRIDIVFNIRKFRKVISRKVDLVMTPFY